MQYRNIQHSFTLIAFTARATSNHSSHHNTACELFHQKEYAVQVLQNFWCSHFSICCSSSALSLLKAVDGIQRLLSRLRRFKSPKFFKNSYSSMKIQIPLNDVNLISRWPANRLASLASSST